jgi:hypothetical protein
VEELAVTINDQVAIPDDSLADLASNRPRHPCVPRTGIGSSVTDVQYLIIA